MKMSEYRRQHPLLMVFDTFRSLPSQIALAFVLSISFASSSLITMPLAFLGIFIGFLAITFLFSAIRWSFFYYSYEPGKIHIRQGIFYKQERTIKSERIQSINVYTNILQRAFGLATLQIKTAGGTAEPEINLRALTMDDIERIKAELIGKDTSDEEEEERYSSRNLEGRDLWLAGATSGRFTILFSVLAVIASQLFPYIPESYIEYALEEIVSFPIVLLVSILLILLFLSWVISAISFMIQYARFNVKRYEDRLELRWGILRQNHVTVALHRIQALVVQEGLIRQPLGLCSLLIEVAGGGMEEKEQTSILFPMLRMSDLGGFVEEILPEYIISSTATALPKRSLSRYMIRALIPTVIFIVLLLAAGEIWGIPYTGLSVILVIPAVVLAYSRYKDGMTAIDVDQLTIRYRYVNRYSVLVKRNHIQSLSVMANPIQRYSSLRSIRVAVLSSPAGKNFTIKDVDKSEADRIWQWYSLYE
ncbi:MAG: putative rane protein [Candidatus Methanomethylophilaceae archaeon]|nr:putative rane protein [Candidatus Methanomethylophilaceae archaeon]